MKARAHRSGGDAKTKEELPKVVPGDTSDAPSEETAGQVLVTDSGILRLVGKLDVTNIEIVHRQVCAATQIHENIHEIDLGGVSSLDITGVQLILALRAQLPASIVHSCPSAFRLELERLGFPTVLT